jgi:hypothetical protein
MGGIPFRPTLRRPTGTTFASLAKTHILRYHGLNIGDTVAHTRLATSNLCICPFADL